MNEDLKRLIAITDAASIGETDICLDTDGWAEIHAHLVELEERRKVRHPEEIKNLISLRREMLRGLGWKHMATELRSEIHTLEWVLNGLQKETEKG